MAERVTGIIGEYRFWWRQHPKWRNIRDVIDWLRRRPKIILR